MPLGARAVLCTHRWYEKASLSSDPVSSIHSNHSLRKLLQSLVYLGNANTIRVKPHSTAGWQDSMVSFSHDPSDHGEVAQHLSGAQSKDRQTPPSPVCLALSQPQLNTSGSTCYRKWLKAKSDPQFPAHWSKDDKPAHRDAAVSPQRALRYRLMENFFPCFIKQDWKQDRAPKQTKLMEFLPLDTELT